MTQPGPKPSPPRRMWVLLALVLALVLTLVIAKLVRPDFAAPAAGRAAAMETTNTEVPTYNILRTPQPVAADGVLDEPVWSRVTAMHFVVYDGKPPVFETEAKLCWDDTRLYAAFSCVDNDIWSTYTKRDEPLYSQEVVEIFLTPRGDLEHYYEFEVSPRNVIWDGRIYNPGPPHPQRTNDKWNCRSLLTGVRVMGTVDDRSDLDQSWTVEIAIPFSCIAATPRDGERWRGNLFRIDRGKLMDEYTTWSTTLTDKPAFHVPARFGWLVFSAKEA